MFWYWNVWVVGSPRPPSPSLALHPWVKTGLPSAVLKTDSTDWNILNYCRYTVLFRKYISFLYREIQPVSIYEARILWKFICSNANTWENFIARVNKTRRWDGFIVEIKLSVLWGVQAPSVWSLSARGSPGREENQITTLSPHSAAAGTNYNKKFRHLSDSLLRVCIRYTARLINLQSGEIYFHNNIISSL